MYLPSSGLATHGYAAAEASGENAVGAAVAWNQDDMDRAMRESLMMQKSRSEPQPGTSLHPADIQHHGLYFEKQVPGSDTCGLNALNNLCQRSQFKQADLQKAEVAHARAQEGGTFMHMAPAQNAPTGFFDLEALKIAAGTIDLELVDVEPVVDFRKSQCYAFSESARACSDGSWFLGFLVYDRQPGQMHYYALRRDERFKGVWLKLDSQLADSGEEQRNRRLTEDDLWGLYEGSRHLFQAWLLRWYPVVYRAGAAKEVCRTLAADPEAYDITEARAASANRERGWVVTSTIRHLLHDLPQTTTRELLVKFARPSESEMRALLEAAQWDLGAAQPAIDQVLRQRITLVQGTDTVNRTRRALSLCNWEPARAATLLALQLQLRAKDEKLVELREALELSEEKGRQSGDTDRAEAVLKLAPAVGSMAAAAALLAQTDTWSVLAAQRVLDVRERFPRVGVPVSMEVLRRNDDDPHAACEMLAEYERRMQKLIMENSSGGDIYKGEEAAIAETALNSTDWDPSLAFVTAKNLALALQQTRRLIRSRGYAQHFPVDVLLPALTAGDMKPQAAASIVLGVAIPSEAVSGPPAIGGSKPLERRPAADEEEDDTCSVM